jgi:hypothetical protein
MDDCDSRKQFACNPMMAWGTLLDPCGVAKMDLHVWDNATERSEGEQFRWNSLPWGVSKARLLDRVKQWNVALEKHCDGLLS